MADEAEALELSDRTIALLKKGREKLFKGFQRPGPRIFDVRFFFGAVGFLDVDLQVAFGVGYQQLKPLMIRLLDDLEFRDVAAAYMEAFNCPEFVEPLSTLYAATLRGRAPADVENERRDAFWREAFHS